MFQIFGFETFGYYIIKNTHPLQKCPAFCSCHSTPPSGQFSKLHVRTSPPAQPTPWPFVSSLETTTRTPTPIRRISRALTETLTDLGSTTTWFHHGISKTTARFRPPTGPPFRNRCKSMHSAGRIRAKTSNQIELITTNSTAPVWTDAIPTSPSIRTA